MSDTVVPSEVDQALADLLRPTRELDAKLAAQEDQLDTELKELRDQRRKLKTVLRALDPTMPKPGKKPVVKAPGLKGFSQEALDQVADWLRAHALEFNANGGFYATELSARHDAPTSQSRMNMALGILHDQGVVTLDHIGSHSRKYYKVILG